MRGHNAHPPGISRLNPSAQGLELRFGNGGAHVSKLFSEYVDDVVLDFVINFYQAVVHEAVLVALLSCDTCCSRKTLRAGTRQFDDTDRVLEYKAHDASGYEI